MQGCHLPALALAIALIAPGCRPPASVPTPLRGRWTSTEPRYAGRSLTLTADSLSFGTSESSSETFAVRGVTTDRDPADGIHYAIAYGPSDRDERELHLYFVYSSPPSVRIGDRPERWQKTSLR